MFLRVQLTLIVDPTDTDTVDKVKTFLQNNATKFRRISDRARERDEVSMVTVHKCYHDEADRKPCEEIFRREF